jgi:hypothetical protein
MLYMDFEVILYLYDSYFIKFLEPNRHVKLKMISIVPDSFICPCQSPVSSSTQQRRIFRLCVFMLKFILPWQYTVELGYNKA